MPTAKQRGSASQVLGFERERKSTTYKLLQEEPLKYFRGRIIAAGNPSQSAKKGLTACFLIPGILLDCPEPVHCPTPPRLRGAPLRIADR